MADSYAKNNAPQVESHRSALPEVGQSVPQWLYPRNARSTSFPMSRKVWKKDAPYRNVQQSTETPFVPSEQNQNRNESEQKRPTAVKETLNLPIKTGHTSRFLALQNGSVKTFLMPMYLRHF